MPREGDDLLSLVTVKSSVPGSRKGQERLRIFYFHSVAAVDAMGSISDGKWRAEEISPWRNQGDVEISSPPHVTELSCH